MLVAHGSQRPRSAAPALLRERPRRVGELTAELGTSRPGTSEHLRVLREAGLVEVQADAQRRRYALRPEPLAELDARPAPYRALWDRSLDTLDRHPDEVPARTPGAGRPPWPEPRPGAEITFDGTPRGAITVD